MTDKLQKNVFIDEKSIKITEKCKSLQRIDCYAAVPPELPAVELEAEEKLEEDTHE